MADFVQTMKDWRRMCNACQPEKDIRGVCGCYPAGNYAPCAMKSMDKEAELAPDNLYFERLEKTIIGWAAEHPEPVYPTWWKYMCTIGVIPDNLGDKTLGDMTVYSLMNTRIQSDIAHKLDIDPEVR